MPAASAPSHTTAVVTARTTEGSLLTTQPYATTATRAVTGTTRADLSSRCSRKTTTIVMMAMLPPEMAMT